jgi:hypothetical protein
MEQGTADFGKEGNFKLDENDESESYIQFDIPYSLFNIRN